MQIGTIYEYDHQSYFKSNDQFLNQINQWLGLITCFLKIDKSGGKSDFLHKAVNMLNITRLHTFK